jgi:hypothetical protein
LANQLYKHCHWSSQGSKMAHLLVVVAWIFYGAKNLSLCIRTLAQSSGWNTTCLRLLLALVAYIHTVPLFNLLLHTLMKCLTTCALQLPSKLTLIQAKKSNPYTILNGGNPIVECTLWLYVNSIKSIELFKNQSFTSMVNISKITIILVQILEI